MFALLSTARKAILSVFALGALAWIASCTPTTVSGPTINTSAPVQVALLVPIGTGDATDGFLASNLENAARMAIADLQGVTIDLRVYDTGADAAQPWTELSAEAQAVLADPGNPSNCFPFKPGRRDWSNHR